jgi:esterase
MTVELAFRETGAGPPVVIVHGLFGSTRNWSGIATQLSGAFRVITVDLRNHGDSPWTESMSYRDMAEDLLAFLDRQAGAGAAVIGHSVGGKVAMMLALSSPATVGRLVVVDIAPVAYSHHFRPIIDGMRAVDLSHVTRRGEVEAQLRATVPETGVRQFLLQNLERRDGTLRWRLNLDALDRGMDELMGFPAMRDEIRYDGPTLFLSGTRSGYVLPQHRPVIRARFPRARFAAIRDAGHWVHAERPTAFVQTVAAFLRGGARAGVQ